MKNYTVKVEPFNEDFRVQAESEKEAKLTVWESLSDSTRDAAAGIEAFEDDTPIWITVDDGDLFEGHQGHWADTFFSNATESQIRGWFEPDGYMRGHKLEIRPMTFTEIDAHPNAIEFRKWLMATYNEV